MVIASEDSKRCVYRKPVHSIYRDCANSILIIGRLSLCSLLRAGNRDRGVLQNGGTANVPQPGAKARTPG